MKIQKFNFKKVNSTNNTAIKIIRKTKLDYGMVVSETQVNGKGQYGKKWISYKGNLFVSVFYNLENINLSIKKLTKINCLIVKKLILKFCKKKIFYKQPNDLLINNKKICGILQERVKNYNTNYLIVGIGINIVKSPILLKYPTTNLYEITGKKLSSELLVNQLRLIFQKNLSKYYKVKVF